MPARSRVETTEPPPSPFRKRAIAPTLKASESLTGAIALWRREARTPSQPPTRNFSGLGEIFLAKSCRGVQGFGLSFTLPRLALVGGRSSRYARVG
jgi:hypothetical protein